MSDALKALEQIIAMQTSRTRPPVKVTVKRNKTTSKQQFLWASRVVRQKVQGEVHFHIYDRKEGDSRLKAIIEEFDVFQGLSGQASKTRVFVLEGFYNTWVKALSPAPDTYVVAETDNGDWEAVNYHHKTRVDGLKVLFKILDLATPPGTPNRLTVSNLRGLDWSGVNSFEEIEAILLRAKMMGYGPEQIGEELTKSREGNFLTVLKRGTVDEMCGLINKRGGQYFLRVLERNLADLIRVRANIAQGLDSASAVKAVAGENWYAKASLEEAATMLGADDIDNLVERLIEMDFITKRFGTLGVELLALNSEVRVRK